MSTEIKYDVFISYSRKDIKEVIAFVKSLKRKIPSLTIWFDLDGIKVADAFEEKVVSAIDSSKCVLFFASNDSMQSKHVKKEISYAENVGKKVIPLLLNGVKLDKGLFLYKFGEINYIDTNNDIHVNQLIVNLCDFINQNKKYSDNVNDINHISDSIFLLFVRQFQKYLVKHRVGIIYVSIIVLLLALVVSYVFVDKNKLFYVNGIFWDMIYVEGGSFVISDDSNSNDKSIVNEQNEIYITLSDYFIGQTEVTQGLWRAVMGENPSFYNGERKPVECVSYEDCVIFIKKLNELTNDTRPEGFVFRLPTEAEWEYAARGGVKRKGYRYSGSDDIASVASYNLGLHKVSESNDVREYVQLETSKVGSKSSNDLSLYDMSGNVWEWCSDWYAEYKDQNNWQTNPSGPISGSFRVLRGGSCSSDYKYCKVSSRFYDNPNAKCNTYGLRLVLGRDMKLK